MMATVMTTLILRLIAIVIVIRNIHLALGTSLDYSLEDLELDETTKLGKISLIDGSC